MDSPPPNKNLSQAAGIRYVAGFALFAALACTMQATDQRPFCASCHVMQEAAVTHKMGTHADRACNDCHLPTGSARLVTKAKASITDFMGNLSGKDVPHPPDRNTRAIVNDNCKFCHAQTNLAVAAMDAKPYCVDCHRNVAHMRYKPVSTRMVAYE
ncbi:MAG: ammonia-forming cytochrome c nitrite reductase small subunit [Candidatus Desulfovibrio kirbyi]|uniref:Ammonia-forming cytochrome c nitrite reductase small subunit n=1 Tax=Candidatus Desulfovibrio kirbyi TaxID=2696086 RepID=A0A6L2R7L0_9BACT|nr:MAG: ammonia-forming cytochrome c nitrite reductase small subunit [Candidatus Desulfovibrio kirbyi]